MKPASGAFGVLFSPLVDPFSSDELKVPWEFMEINSPLREITPNSGRETPGKQHLVAPPPHRTDHLDKSNRRATRYGRKNAGRNFPTISQKILTTMRSLLFQGPKSSRNPPPRPREPAEVIRKRGPHGAPPAATPTISRITSAPAAAPFFWPEISWGSLRGQRPLIPNRTPGAHGGPAIPRAMPPRCSGARPVARDQAKAAPGRRESHRG